MKGTIVNFRRARKHTSSNHMIVVVEGVENKEQAKTLVGKKVSWKTPGTRVLTGKVSAPHGSNGAIRVIFETGMPGQATSTPVEIE